LSQDDLKQARRTIAKILPHLADNNLNGVREPFRIYRTCYRVLEASHDPQADEVLATAHRLLQERAARIEDERLRRSYLEIIPAHRAIIQAHAST
jgi:hypothetical protein